MLHELTYNNYDRVRPLFQALDDHLAVIALLDGATPGHVYVDDPKHPRAALAQVKYRFHLAGSPATEAFNAALGSLFADTIYPQALAAGAAMFTLAYMPASWEAVIEAALREKHPIKAQRQYYEWRQPQDKVRAPDTRRMLPEGFSLHAVDAALLARTQLRNLVALKEEMCSERPTVQDFLEGSFGVCLVHGNDLPDAEIAGWCLSEYNTGQRCEVGIETVGPYRRRGLATLMTHALIDLALTGGLTRIGWHCWASNTPSAATALKAGLVKVSDYPVYFAWFDEASNLAVHGNISFDRQQYAEALRWYEQAFAHGNTWAWAYWNAAQAAAAQGQNDVALRYLAQAIDRGFDNVRLMQQSVHLYNLHDTVEWRALLAHLEQPRNLYET
jgi:tetratricopeptide (TPR) repeat protein